MKIGNKMIEMILIGLFGVLVGVGGTVGIQKATKKDPPVVVVGDQIAEGQIEVQKELIDLDLLVEPCSKEYIESKNDLLCREMFCRMQQRGIDAATSQVDCSEISNIANTIAIQRSCSTLKGDDLDTCIELFFKRK